MSHLDKDLWNALSPLLHAALDLDPTGRAGLLARATHRRVDGADAFVDLCKGWAAAFPDSRPEFHNAVASGQTVVLELTWTGTHTGPLATPTGDVAPTGKSINLRSIQVVEVRDGKAAGTRQYFDMATMMSQLGLAT
jgi:steroid delta-isomerase-like uncharacterized protein